MKTLFYYRPTFQGRGDPFYKSDQFAHSCSGHRIAIYKRDGGGHPMYLMSRSPKQAGLAADYIKQVLQQNAFDMVFEDDAGFAPYQLGIHPCNLQASEWIDRDARLEKEVHAKQLPSSLNAFTEDGQHVWTQNQQSLDLALHHEGGLMEQCYSSNSNPQVYFISDTLWVAQENTEIADHGRQQAVLLLRPELQSGQGSNRRANLRLRLVFAELSTTICGALGNVQHAIQLPRAARIGIRRTAPGSRRSQPISPS